MCDIISAEKRRFFIVAKASTFLNSQTVILSKISILLNSQSFIPVKISEQTFIRISHKGSCPLPFQSLPQPTGSLSLLKRDILAPYFKHSTFKSFQWNALTIFVPCCIRETEMEKQHSRKEPAESAASTIPQLKQ